VSKRAIGAFLLALVPLWSAGGVDKTKKAYELIYEDVQVLKKQVQDLAARAQKNAEDVQVIKDQLKELADVVRRSQAEQLGLKEDLRSVPQQYQALAGKIEQLSLDVARLVELLAALRPGTPPAAGAEAKPAEKGRDEPQPSLKKPENKPQSMPLPSNVSPQDVYNMAYSDYLKGNFDLAVEGFRMYKDQFSDSPLADNALYWIGECYYSQRKFEDAINMFNELILAYPQGDKIAAAYLKKGMSFAETGKKEEAMAAYKLLITKFPVEEETRIAQQKIKELAEK
jgi:tol-pal system protein YbgF